MKKQNVRTLSLVIGTITYLLIGASIFDYVESEEEKRQKEALRILEDQMMAKYKISPEDDHIMSEVVPLMQPFKAGKPWQFAGAFYYATTVLTTIGYGHSTPKTDAGRTFTIMYASCGIPLGLIMFNSIGERFNNFTSIIVGMVRKTLKAKHTEAKEIDLMGIVLFLSLILTISGASMFSHFEGWDYLDSLYYSFTTLTTIGFGDYVALQQDNALEKKIHYVVLVISFILFGLAIIAAALNLMVLKLMTLNTEDEKRDEEQAMQNAAKNPRLHGDIILQQNEVSHWQVEGEGSMQEIRSVCSCTCNSCNPFQQINRREIDINPLDQDENEFQTIVGGGENMAGLRCSSNMKWYSTESLVAGRGMAIAPGTPEHEKKELIWTSKKAVSIHDLQAATFLDDQLEVNSTKSMNTEVNMNSDHINRLLPPVTPVSRISSKSGETMRISKDKSSTDVGHREECNVHQDMDEDSLNESLHDSGHVMSSNRPDSPSSQNNNTWRFISSFRRSARKILPHRHKKMPTTCTESYALDEINSIHLITLQNMDDNRIPL